MSTSALWHVIYSVVYQECQQVLLRTAAVCSHSTSWEGLILLCNLKPREHIL